jgi:hypothetical protein
MHILAILSALAMLAVALSVIGNTLVAYRDQIGAALAGHVTEQNRAQNLPSHSVNFRPDRAKVKRRLTRPPLSLAA